MLVSADLAEFLFRVLFCLIFIGLGGEHIFSDTLIQHLMPEWVPVKRTISVLCGLWLLGWSSLILLGVHVRLAARALGLFLIVVTLFVHLPGIIHMPIQIEAQDAWMWTILQRSNLVKNLCLLGVCFHLLYHEVGRYSLTRWMEERGKSI